MSDEIKFYSVPKTAKGINLFLELLWKFHDFRIYEVHYYPEKDCIDLIIEYDADDPKVLLRFEGTPFMNYAWQDFRSDWMFSASIHLTEQNSIIWIADEYFDYKEPLPKDIFWIRGERLTWTIVDDECKPRSFSFDELHPGWIDLDIDEANYSVVNTDEMELSENFAYSPLSVSYNDLIKNYPPKFSNHIKADFYKAAVFEHKDIKGTLNVYQCTFNREFSSDNFLTFSDINISSEKQYFNYKDCTSAENKSVWYLNFADSNLFGFYGSNLFAQDEIQTLEHPLLCSLKEYLLKNRVKSIEPKTVYLNKANDLCYPTPVLIEDVPYWISVDTKPVLDDGNIGNLYGNNFALASEEEIAAGIQLFDGDIKSNIIAVAALSGGREAYSKNDIEFTFKTVLCAFEKARFISQAHNELSEELTVSVHTGNWGCGAFGGNREFMYLVQMIAASAAKINEIVFHAVDKTSFNNAKAKFESLEKMTLNECIEYLYAQNYLWGASDGN